MSRRFASPWQCLTSAILSAALLNACGVPPEAEEVDPGPDLASAEAALSGSHYNLNIIGMAKGKSPNLGGGEGHRIFVKLDGRTDIACKEGAYGVLDANGTDGYAAYSMPNPDPDGDGTTLYSVYVRALGKPGGSMSMTTCAYDEYGEEYCSAYSAVAVRSKGKQEFTNVTRELLYMYYDMDGDGRLERYSLFDDRLQDYFWAYDNKGLRIAQLRFYEHATTVE